MASIGIFFGTDTGKTRKIAKMIQQKLGDAAATPLNINRTDIENFLAWPVLILGTPTLGDGQLPGLEAGCEDASWGEFLAELSRCDLNGKTVALFGLGDQKGYPDSFVSGLRPLYDTLKSCGAQIIGQWPTEGYEFVASLALEDDRFVGLAIDQDNQYDLTEERVDAWLATLRPAIL